MDKSKTLKRIVYMLVALFAAQEIMLIWFLKPNSVFIWASLVTLAILFAYVVVITVMLIKKCKDTINQ